MKRPVDLARRFLAMADRDIKAFLKLVPDPAIDDAIVGFLAQQAVEKCLKAVLVLHKIELHKTHNLRILLKLLADSTLPVPPMRDEIAELNPFAVTMRYELSETEPLDRTFAKKVVDSVRKWAEECAS